MITLLRRGWLAAWDGARHQLVERGEVEFQDRGIVYAGPGTMGMLTGWWIDRRGSSALGSSTCTAMSGWTPWLPW